MKKRHNYISTVFLMFSGDALDPDLVSNKLGMKPDQSWWKGDRLEGDKRKQAWGIWKKFLPNELNRKPCEEQVNYWLKLLGRRNKGIAYIKRKGCTASLKCIGSAEDHAQIVLLPRTLEKIAALGFEISFAIRSAK